MNPQLKQNLSELFTICMNGGINFEYSAKHDRIQVTHFNEDNELLFNEFKFFYSPEDISLFTIKVKKYISRKLENELKQVIESEKAGLTK